MVAVFAGTGSGFVRSSATTLGGAGMLGGALLGRIGESVSLNAANGNLLVTQRDEFLSGRGLDIAIGRTYNSLADTGDRDNGDNWQMGTSRRIFGHVGSYNGTNATVKLLAADGSVTTYRYESRLVNGVAVSAYWSTDGDGAFDKLTWLSATSTWLWTDGSSQATETNETAVTSGEWRLKTQSDPDQNVLTFSYLAGGDLLDKVTNANGEWIQYLWSGSQLSRISTGVGGATLSRTWYLYTAGRLSEVRVDMTPSENVQPDQSQSYWTQYSYDANGRLSRILQKDGSQVDIVYDGSGRVITVTQSGDVGLPRATGLTYGSSYTLVTSPDGQQTRLDYDAASRLTKITAPPAYSGATAQAVQFFYDTDSNLTKVTSADLKDTTYSYDTQGNVTLSTDPNGNTVRRWYDSSNRLVATRAYATDNGVANVAEYVRYAYDGEGHLRYMVSPEGRVIEYRYTGSGLLEYTVEYPEHFYSVAHVEGTVLTEATMDGWRNAIADKQSIKLSYSTYDARGNLTSLLNYGYGTGGTGSPGSGILTEGWSRTNYVYDAAGRLLSRNLEGRAAETYVYDSLGRVTSMVDPQGGTTTVVFNDAASQTVITTARGYTTTQTFNKAGELIAWTGSGNAFDVSTGNASSNVNAYDRNGRLRVATGGNGEKTYYIYDKAGRLTGTADHYGALIEYRYDAANRIVAQTRYYNALSAATLTTLADPNNGFELTSATRPPTSNFDVNSWSVYDAGGRLIQSIGGDGSVAEFSYDQSDRLIKTTNYATKINPANSTLTGGGTTNLTVSPPTSTVVVTTAVADTVSRTFYDGEGLLVGSLDGEGYLVEFLYDQAGQKIQDIAYSTKTTSSLWASGDFAALRASSGTAGRRTYYTYDGEGHLRYHTDNAGRVTSYSYDNAGNLTATRAHAAAIAPADYSYDAVKSATVLGTNDRTSALTYYATGKVATSTDALGTVTTFTYETVGGIANSGNLIKTQVGSGAEARITRNWYNAEGLLRFTVDAEGYVRRYDYDANDKKIREILWDAAISVNDATTIDNINSLVGGTFTDHRWSYGLDGQLNSEFDGEGVETRYVYLKTGQLQSVFRAWGTPDETQTIYYYDGAGRLIEEHGAAGTAYQTVTKYAYDGLGNLISVIDPRNVTTTYSYDEVGQVKTKVEASGSAIARTTVYSYNAFGEVLTAAVAGVLQSTTAYDSLGRVSTVTDANGYVTTYTYTNFGDVQSVTRAGATSGFEYDKLGRLTKSTDALGFFESYTYDAFGNRTTKTSKSATENVQAGGTITYTFDRRGLLLSEELPIKSYDVNGAASTANIKTTYAYDSRGNLISKTSAAGLTEARTTQFVYDKNNLLTQAIELQGWVGQTYGTTNSYDKRGNLRKSVDPNNAPVSNFYDDLDRLVASVSPNGTYTTYTYEANGNVATTRVYANPVAVGYDGGAASLAPAAPAGGYRETIFTYDALGRRVSSAIVGVTSGVYNGTSWIAYAGSAQTIATTFEYDALGNVSKSIDAEGNTTYSYYDAGGRKTAQVDGENYVTTWTYNADGNVQQETRFATKFVGTPGATAPSVATNALDRITTYTYDAVGNRLTEARSAVKIHDGAGAYSTVTATISYLYNGLGQVVRKTEATGDQINYTYDVAGRLVSEARAAFVDQSGTSVTPTVDYYYNGNGNLTRTRARGSASAAERVTTYYYSGGRLNTIRDAETQDGYEKDGKTTYFWYDPAGNRTGEYYARYDASGNATSILEGKLYLYSPTGQVLRVVDAVYTASGWVEVGPRTDTTYNAFGEVATISVGGVLQQSNEYDAGGRLVATNAGDNLWKYFGYDRNGNQTIAITNAGFDLAGQGFAGALAKVGQADVNAIYTRFDKRNMATSVAEEGRQFSIGGAAQTLNTTRVYNAFGEVASETNAAGATIDYSYNTMGRLIKTESPLVEITQENGTKVNVRPTEQYYHDQSGRLVASRDANNNLTRLTLLAGSGYGDSQAQVTSELHADGGTRTTKYDIHGDARQQIDELGRQTNLTYDKMGRLVQRQELRNAGTSTDDLTSTYVYDGLGQQLRFSVNALPGDDQVTNYDVQGRVTYARAFGGDVTTTSYAWDAALATTGVGTFGGWAITTTMANGLYSIQKSDLAGRATFKRDLGGHQTSFTYDVAGRLSSSTIGTLTTKLTWLNSGYLAKQMVDSPTAGTAWTSWTRDVATYSYDVSGNRLSEAFDKIVATYTPAYQIYNAQDDSWDYFDASYYEATTQVKNATATYDALGRLRTWAEAGNVTSPAASIANEYDAAGNVRRTNSTYRTLDAQGNPSTNPLTRDYWFRFDNMNRVVVNQGVLQGGVIVRGVGTVTAAAGQDIAYNVAGQRTSITTTTNISGVDTTKSELYSYDDAGRLSQTSEVAGTPGSGGAVTRSVYGYDLLGRQTSQSDYAANGTQVIYSRTASYDNAGKLLSDYTSTLKTDNKTYTATTSYGYGSGSGYMLGAVVSQATANWVTGGSTINSTTTNSYVWFDGALQSLISYVPNTSQPGTSYGTLFFYNDLGQLTNAQINDGKPHSVTFTNDELGQIVRRDESNISGQTGAPHEVWYRFEGNQLGYTGNNGTNDMAMAASIDDRRVVTPTNQGTFRNKQMTGSTYSDFAQNYDPINSYSQGAAGGSYQVQRGDTLQSIAQRIWGDGSLWYKIADLNGLGAGSALIEGQRLILPSGVLKSGHNAASTNPYDPAEAMGDLAPSTSPKPKKKNCGFLGQILIAVIGIAVAVWAGPGAVGLFQGLGTFGSAVAGGALAGAAGSIASQAVGVATGIQAKFSWKGVALAALAGAVGGALKGAGEAAKAATKAGKSLGTLTKIGNFLGRSDVVGNIARAGVSSIVTQGVATATGLQNKFSWAGVAAATVAAGVGRAIGGDLNALGEGGDNTPHNVLQHTVVGGASLIASAATRSAFNGSSFGDNIIAGLPDVIGQAVGSAIGGKLLGGNTTAGAQEAIAPNDADIVVNGGFHRYLGSGSSHAQLEFALTGAPVAAPVAAHGYSDESSTAALRDVVDFQKVSSYNADDPDITVYGQRFPRADFAPPAVKIAMDWVNAISGPPPETQFGFLATLGSNNAGIVDAFKDTIAYLRYGNQAAGDRNWNRLQGIGRGLSNLASDALTSLPMNPFVSHDQRIAATRRNGDRGWAIAGGVKHSVGLFAGGFAQLTDNLITGSNHDTGAAFANALQGTVELGANFVPISKAGALATVPGKGIIAGESVPLRIPRPGDANFIGPVDFIGPRLPADRFSISDWSGYPAGLQQPKGPFRILEGVEYDTARTAADSANDAIRVKQGLRGVYVDVHEIHPVKFGGSPTDPANKIILNRDFHRQQVTPWWNQLQRDLGK